MKIQTPNKPTCDKTQKHTTDMSRVQLFLFAALLVATASAVRVVHIIRHGEKPTDPNDPNLSPEGFERAACSA